MDLFDIESRALRFARALGALSQMAGRGGAPKQQMDLTTDNLASLFDILEQEADAMAALIHELQMKQRAA